MYATFCCQEAPARGALKIDSSDSRRGKGERKA